MEDSFFGFHTGCPLDDDGGGRIAEPSEEEYDALNDETFGSAINGDWEEVHENLVRLDDGKVNADETSSNKAKTDDDSDLEVNLAKVNLDDFDICFDDGDSSITMDPTVWGNSLLSTRSPENDSLKPNNSLYPSPQAFLREHFPSPFNNDPNDFPEKPKIKPIQPPKKQTPAPPSNVIQANAYNTPKFCTLEDIEKSLIEQSLNDQGKKKQVAQTSQADLANQVISSTPKPKVATNATPSTPHPQQQQMPQAPPPQMQQQHQQNPMNSQQQHDELYYQFALKYFLLTSIGPPPGFNGPRPNFNNVPQQGVNNHMLQPGMQGYRKIPPCFPAITLLPFGMQPPHQMSKYPGYHLPVALNNFAMHPNFNAVRPGPPPMLPNRMHQMPNIPNRNVVGNHRLVQEIQQTHPLLPNIRHPFNAPTGGNMMNNQQMQQQQHQYNRYDRKQNHMGSNVNQNIGYNQNASNGNLPDEYDEYANLMSTRDKHWLINIQLSQLNTDTPYIDDYYYTVFKKRKADLSGDSGESKTHKDNQMFHPLTQPKGHAQLILVSLGNKNGTHNRNGKTNREHRNSETRSDGSKYENSLGKLQYGSVTAPRKIIDMDIMGSEGNSQLSAGVEVSAQRKSRHILLHIETLYRIVLKLEDLDNPTAIANILTKKETERQQMLEEMENTNKLSGVEEKSKDHQADDTSEVKNNFSYEIEPKEVLLSKLIAGLTHDKVVAMMNVRKGKILVRRLMKHIEDNSIRWIVWTSVFNSLHTIYKKDRDDTEGVLFSLYPEFRDHIKKANFETLVKLASSIPLNDKKPNNFFSSKFGISSLVCLILQAEKVYSTGEDETFNSENQETWKHTLDALAISLSRTIQNQTICAAIESDSIDPMLNHFGRFKDLKLDSLLALISQVKGR